MACATPRPRSRPFSPIDFLADYDNRTALHLAAAEGHLDAVEFFVLQLGSKRPVGGTPIRDAEAGGHRSVVEYLERNGAIRRPSRVEDECAASPADLVDMTGSCATRPGTATSSSCGSCSTRARRFAEADYLCGNQPATGSFVISRGRKRAVIYDFHTGDYDNRTSTSARRGRPPTSCRQVSRGQVRMSMPWTGGAARHSETRRPASIATETVAFQLKRAATIWCGEPKERVVPD